MNPEVIKKGNELSLEIVSFEGKLYNLESELKRKNENLQFLTNKLSFNTNLRNAVVNQKKRSSVNNNRKYGYEKNCKMKYKLW